MSAKSGRYGQAGKLIKEAQEYDFSSNDELVSSFMRHVGCVRKSLPQGLSLGLTLWPPLNNSVL